MRWEGQAGGSRLLQRAGQWPEMMPSTNQGQGNQPERCRRLHVGAASPPALSWRWRFTPRNLQLEHRQEACESSRAGANTHHGSGRRSPGPAPRDRPPPLAAARRRTLLAPGLSADGLSLLCCCEARSQHRERLLLDRAPGAAAALIVVVRCEVALEHLRGAWAGRWRKTRFSCLSAAGAVSCRRPHPTTAAPSAAATYSRRPSHRCGCSGPGRPGSAYHARPCAARSLAAAATQASPCWRAWPPAPHRAGPPPAAAGEPAAGWQPVSSGEDPLCTANWELSCQEQRLPPYPAAQHKQ